MEERKSFTFFRSFYDAAKLIGDPAEQAGFLMAVCQYALDGTEPELTGTPAAMFVLTRELPYRLAVQTVVMAVILYLMDSYVMQLGPIRIPIEMFALMAIVPISQYSGRKGTRSRAVQWGFYLFYPVHLTVLFLIRLFL